MESIIIGIAGGSGSGKSTFTNRLKKHFGDAVLLEGGRQAVPALAGHLAAAARGAAGGVEQYGFLTHSSPLLCLLDVDEERLVLGHPAVRVAHVRRQVVDDVSGGEVARPAEVVRHAHLVHGLAVHLERLKARRDQRHDLDRPAVVEHADALAVLDALFGRQFHRHLDELLGHGLVEGRAYYSGTGKRGSSS